MRRLQIAVIGLIVAVLVVGVALAQTPTAAGQGALTFEPIDSNATATPAKPRSPRPTATEVGSAARGRGLTTETAPSAAAPTADCDSAELRVWLLTQQNAIRETAALFHASQGREAADLVNDILAQLSEVETESRPGCADVAMVWTYYLYTTWIESAICRTQANAACRDNVVSRAETTIEQSSAVFEPLLKQAGLSSFDLTSISLGDIAVESMVAPSSTPSPTPTPTSPRKTSPRAQTPVPPTPNSGRGSARGPQERAIRSAIDSSLMTGRVNGVEVIDADSIAELRGLFTGRGVIVAFSVSTLQQAAYPTDSILLMETVATTISSQQFDLQFLIIVAFDPDSQSFSKAALVSINDVLDYQAGRITRDQLLKAIENIDNNTLPQV